MFKVIVCSVSCVCLAASTAAQAPTDQASPTLTRVQDPNRMICQREEVIGSRLGGKKICKTAQEWQESQQQARDQIDDWQRRLPALPKPGDPG